VRSADDAAEQRAKREAAEDAAREEGVGQCDRSVRRIRRLVHRLREIAGDAGPRGLWFAALGEIGYRRVLVREFVFSWDLPDVALRVPVTFGQLSAADVAEYNAFRLPADPQSAARRLHDGHQCFVARHDGQIVSACWVATGTAWSSYLASPIALAPGDVYLYGVYTRPDLRGKGLAAAVHAEIYRVCRAQGHRRALGYLVPENRRSMSRHFGLRTIGRIASIRIGPFRRDFVQMLKT
jgi:GNAT superfamily N-acetyltransferase